MQKSITIFCLLISMVLSSFNSMAHTWTRTYGEANAQANKIIQLQDGGFLVICSGEEMLIKTDSLGFMQWQVSNGLGLSGTATDAVQTVDGNIYLTRNTTINSVAVIGLLKFDSQGNFLWVNQYGGTQSEFGNAITSTGNSVVIAGKINNILSGSGSDALLMKVDSSGSLLWSRTYGTVNDDEAFCVSVLSDGGFILGGTVKTSVTLNLFTGYALRTDLNGDTLWTKICSFIGSASYPQLGFYSCTQLKGDSTIAFTGLSQGLYGNMVAATFRMNGEVKKYFLSSALADLGKAVAATDDGGFIIAGCGANFGGFGISFKFSSGGDFIEKQYYYYLSSSNRCWSNSFFNGVVVTTDNHFVFCGATSLFSNANYAKILLLKTCDDGYYFNNNEIITASSPAFCKGNTDTLFAPPGYDHYQWYWFDYRYMNHYITLDSSILIVDSAGAYQCVMWNDNMVSISNKINVVAIEIPNTEITSSSGLFEFCLLSGNVSLSVPKLPYNYYTWSLNSNIIYQGLDSASIFPQAIGVYAVSVANMCGSANSSPVNVDINALPVVHLDDTVHLPLLYDQTSSCIYHHFNIKHYVGTSYLWYHNGMTNGWTQSFDSINEPGTYFVIAQNSCGTDTSNISYVVYDTLKLTYDKPLNNCSSSPIRFTAPAGATNYIWFKNGSIVCFCATYNTYATSSPGAYSCLMQQKCGNSTINSYSDVVSYQPTYVAHGISLPAGANFCNGSPVQLNAFPSGIQYQWYRNDTLLVGAALSSFITHISGNYSCLLTSACDTILSQHIFLDFDLPDATQISTSGNSAICRSLSDSTTVQLKIDFPYVSNYQYKWRFNNTNISGATNSYYNTKVPGWYRCFVFNSCGIALTDSFYLKDYFVDKQIYTTASQYLCDGDTQVISLTYDSVYSYQWFMSNNHDTIPGADSSAYIVSSANNYYATIITPGCSVGAYGIGIYRRRLPLNTILPSSSLNFCGNDSVKLNAYIRSDYNYQWFENNNPVLAATQNFYYGSQNAVYSVVITDSFGCSSVSPDVVVSNTTIAPLFVFSNACNESCEMDSVMLSATSGFSTYQWLYNNDTIPGAVTNTVLTDTSGLYTVLVSDVNGCYGTSNYSLTILPRLTLLTKSQIPEECGVSNGSISLMFNKSALRLTINSPNGYNAIFQYGYYGGSGYYLNNLKAGWYYFTCSYLYGGCEITDSIEVTNSLFFTPVLNAYDTMGCQGKLFYLYNYENYPHYLWSTGQTTSNITVTNSGTYILTVSDSLGCTGQVSVNVTVYPLPVANISPPGTINICAGNVIALDAGAGNYQYHWSNGQNSQSINVGIPGNYVVTITENQHHCSGKDTVIVEINPLPENSIDSTGAISVCVGTSITPQVYLSNAQYLWSSGETTLNIFPISTGNYVLTITNDSTGCLSRDSVYITVHLLPDIVINSNDSVNICSGDLLTPIIYPLNSNYLWSTGETQLNIIPTTTDLYNIAVTDSNGCVNNDSAFVVVNALPIVMITPASPVNTCFGQSVVLSVNSGYSNYQWSNGATDSAVMITASGNYSVTVIDANGCSNTDSVIVTQATVLSANATFNNPSCSFCCDGSATVNPTGGNPPYTYLWSNSFTTQSVTNLCNGLHFVTVTDLNGCVDSATISFATGINEIENSSDITIYPNPAENYVSINSNYRVLNNITLLIKDMIGRTIIKTTVDDTRYFEVQIAQLVNGVYAIEMHNANGLIFKSKLVKH